MTRTLIFALSFTLIAPACDKPESAADPAVVTPASPAAPAKALAAKAPAAEATAKPAAPAKAAAAAAVQPTAAPKAKPSAPAAKPAPSAPPTAARLLTPAKATEEAPDTFKVKFETTKGVFIVQIHRAWAPTGVDRFYNLVKVGFFSDVAFFRVIAGFMAQFGIHGDPKVSTAWRSARITDDPVDSSVASNTRGKLTFAMAGPNTRTTQLFVSFADRNKRLDGMGFPPIGEIVDGMNVVDRIHSGYGEGAPRGRGPAQGRLQSEGNAYLKAEFPALDYIKSATILP